MFSKSHIGLALVVCSLLTCLAVPAAGVPAIATVQVTVVATGNGTLSYQWFRAGAAVAGATSSSISVPAGDASLYTVILTDVDGGTQTAGATVTVSPAVPPVTPPPPPSAAGPRAAVGPQASITCTGTPIAADAGIQAAVNGKPAGTTFCLAAGTHSSQHIVPKSGDKFIGAVGTILDGGGRTVRAFQGNGSTPNVTVQNLTIQNYAGGYQVAAVESGGGSGWQILNNEIRNNDGVGMSVGAGSLTRYNFVHHNLEMGIGTGGSGSGTQVLDNEIAFNNYTNKYDCGNECGGGKFWATTGLVFSYNYSHDNHGPGIWDDYNNTGLTYSFNRIENNLLSGIMHEIGYSASIHDNVITGNGVSKTTINMNPPCVWLWCGGILISASGGASGGQVEIYNNMITTPGSWANAVSLVQQNRTVSGGLSPSMGPYLIQNVYVHDNAIDLSAGGGIGGVTDFPGGQAMFTTRNNRFQNNRYKLGTNKVPFQWSGKSGSQSFWQGLGMDLNGTFK